DHAAGGLHVQFAVLDDGGADGDGEVRLVVPAPVADRAAVDAALDGLEFGDDLHRAHFRRAGQRAGGKGSAEHVHEAQTRLQLADDFRNDVHDVRVAFHDHVRGEFHAAGLGDAADIIAAEVDQHHVLGAFLGIGEQLG